MTFMTNESEKEIIPFDKLPEELMHGLPSYSVTLIGFRNNSDFTPYGTGTLIKSGCQHFIFTAAHCAERLADYDEIGLPIRLSGYPLVGCAFYQTKAEGGFRYIRCHGPRSIYGYGLSILKSL